MIGLNETYSWMDGDRLIEVKRCFVRYNFFDVMGIPLIDGEGFRLSSQRRDDCSVVNRHIAELMSLEVGDDFAGCKVVGITDDVMMHDVSQNKVSLEWLCGTEDMRFFYVRVRGGGDIKRVCDFIRSSVREFDPAADEPSIEFVDQHVARLYDKVKRQTVLVSMFALLSVVISLMGVFGIVLFETQHRRREIAVRRVFGASTSGIIWMLNRRYGGTRGVVCRRPMDGAFRKPYRHLVAHIPRCSGTGAGHNFGIGYAAQLARRQREPLARTGRRVT